jgi:type IV pilus assembly protein PilO
MEEHKTSFLEKVAKIRMPIRILILVGTIVLIAGAFAWFVYLPKNSEITRTQKEITTLSRKLAQVKKKARDLDKFEKELERVNAQFKEALRILPDSKEIPRLLTDITKLGNESGLQFLLFSPQQEVARDFYVEIPVAIRVSGTYHNVARFFDRVGKMDRIVNILDVSMKPEKSLSTDLITSCTAVTYRFKAEGGGDEEGK